MHWFSRVRDHVVVLYCNLYSTVVVLEAERDLLSAAGVHTQDSREQEVCLAELGAGVASRRIEGPCLALHSFYSVEHIGPIQ